MEGYYCDFPEVITSLSPGIRASRTNNDIYKREWKLRWNMGVFCLSALLANIFRTSDICNHISDSIVGVTDDGILE